jgi:LacI family transcriptional regulator
MASNVTTRARRHVDLAYPLAVQDYRARVVIEECDRLGLNIPHDVAVIGMEDAPTLCEFCRPTLSSVSRISWRLGFETAAMLDQLMDGKPRPPEVVVPSDGVVARQSTDTIAVDDRHLAAAVHFIHDHLSEPFGVDRMRLIFLRGTGMTPLEYRQRGKMCHTGTTPTG